jgi:phosphatidylserine synthase
MITWSEMLSEYPFAENLATFIMWVVVPVLIVYNTLLSTIPSRRAKESFLEPDGRLKPAWSLLIIIDMVLLVVVAGLGLFWYAVYYLFVILFTWFVFGGFLHSYQEGS